MSWYKLKAFPPTTSLGLAKLNGKTSNFITSLSIASGLIFIGITTPLVANAIIVLPVAVPAITGGIFTLLLLVAIPATFSGLFFRFFGIRKGTSEVFLKVFSILFYHIILFTIFFVFERFTPRIIRVTPIFTLWIISAITAWAFLAPQIMHVFYKLRGRETFEPNFYQGFRYLLWNLIFYFFLQL